MAELEGKKQRLRKAITKLKSLNTTQAMKKATGGQAAAIVHPEVIAANRSSLAQAVRSNFFGLNAPSIAATESQYTEMWASDVQAMTGYHGDSGGS
ncbi:MAG: PPE family protein [Candidatus Obscuribacterales bacterium]|nr:PPE family protein [Candidatus Obscuribacterales bacterium]